jgi:PHP family Zn ribbon phosphoesterase
MKCCAATITDVVLIQAHPLKHVISRTVHRASVIQTVKQIVQLFRKRYTEDVMVVQQSTCVADSLMCIKYIINPA